MKKIFAISFLSLMAVTGGARAEVEQYNLNLATAEYVEDIADELSNMIYDKVDQGYVVKSGDTVGDAYKDSYIPTIARVEAAIANDTSGLVERAQVVTSDGVDMDGNDISSELTPDQVVPTVANVEANFVPNEADVYKDDLHGIVETAMRPGLYTIMVGVDDNGNKSFIWQAVQESTDVSSVGGGMPN